MSDKSTFHPKNKHQGKYDFSALANSSPELNTHLIQTEYGKMSIDFHNPVSVKALNKALLIHFYNLEHWDIPNGYLCPPIPSRSDYIHYIADELKKLNQGKYPRNIQAIDIGTGANLIYPLIGTKEYKWNFTASDIDKKAIENADEIITKNNLHQKIKTNLQENKNHFFKGIFKEDYFDITVCNPPFHASAEEAEEGSVRKINNLKGNKNTALNLNFGGKNNELWYEGGELSFLNKMIIESELFKHQCFIFSSLISKEKNIKPLISLLEKLKATKIKTIPMVHGNKKSRILLWSFLNKKQMDAWVKFRWK